MKPFSCIFSMFREISEEFLFYLLAFLHEKMTSETVPVGHSPSISSCWEWSGWDFSSLQQKKRRKKSSLFGRCFVFGSDRKVNRKKKGCWKQHEAGSPAVVSRSGEVVGAFFSSQFFLSGFLWDNKHAHFWHRHCCCCRKHNSPADPGVEGGELRSQSNGLF